MTAERMDTWRLPIMGRPASGGGGGVLGYAVVQWRYGMDRGGSVHVLRVDTRADYTPQRPPALQIRVRGDQCVPAERTRALVSFDVSVSSSPVRRSAGAERERRGRTRGRTDERSRGRRDSTGEAHEESRDHEFSVDGELSGSETVNGGVDIEGIGEAGGEVERGRRIGAGYRHRRGSRDTESEEHERSSGESHGTSDEHTEGREVELPSYEQDEAGGTLGPVHFEIPVTLGVRSAQDTQLPPLPPPQLMRFVNDAGPRGEVVEWEIWMSDEGAHWDCNQLRGENDGMCLTEDEREEQERIETGCAQYEALGMPPPVVCQE